MKYRKITPDDLPAVRRLWTEAFEETEEQSAPFLCTVFPLCTGWCSEEDGQLAAMAFSVPAQAVQGEKTWPVRYVYAVATAEAFRGRGAATGVMQALEQDAREQGAAALLLLPAEPGLFPFYDRMGFRVWSWASEVSVGALTGEDVRRLTPEEYLRIRESYAPEETYIRPMPEVVSLCAALYAWDGGCCAVEDGAFGPLCCELLGSSRGLAAAAADYGIARLPVTRCGGGYPYAMAKPLTVDFPESGRFSFGMD